MHQLPDDLMWLNAALQRTTTLDETLYGDRVVKLGLMDNGRLLSHFADGDCGTYTFFLNSWITPVRNRKRGEKKSTPTLFFNDGLNDVMDVMVDSLVNGGSFVDDRSFLFSMRLNFVTLPVSSKKFIKTVYPYQTVGVLENLLLEYSTIFGLVGVNFFDMSYRVNLEEKEYA